MRVLICEDERHIARLLQVNFEKQGWTVSLAVGGHEALAAMGAHVPDMVLLDPTLPDMTTSEFIEALQADPRLSNVKVVTMGK